MAISGHIELEDLVIEFKAIPSDGPEDHAYVRVTSEVESTEYWCKFKDLTNALAIMIHHDGEPNAARDYPSAERAQPRNPGLRFIP